MSCQSCNKPSNHQYANCPPKMSDGRMFTDYRPRCIANFATPGLSEIPGNYNLPNSFEYRQYLIKNAGDIMKKNSEASYAANSCAPCVNPYMEGTMLPEQRVVKCDANTCTFSQKDPKGLGLGRDYSVGPIPEPADSAKVAFLSSKEAQQQWGPNPNKPIDLGYYGYNNDSAGDMMNRPMIPSGR